MIRWPWVGRGLLEHVQRECDSRVPQLAYDAVVEERNRLRMDNARLVENLTRVVRKTNGMSEVPREAKGPIDPMPRDLDEYIDGFASKPLRAKMRKDCWRARTEKGLPWTAIKQELMDEEKGPE